MPAIRIRSDIERKRLHGLPRLQNTKTTIGSGLYSDANIEQTYGVLAAFCKTGLNAGFNMIADATFAKRHWRSQFIDLARSAGARPVIFECSAPLETLKARIRQRMAEDSDESDADLEVLEYQLTHFEPLDPAERFLAASNISSLLVEETQESI